MSIEENKALVRHFLEAHAGGDLETMEQMLAPDFVDHNLIPGQQPGREGYLRSFTEYHAAYSNTRYVIEKQVAEGDEVVTTFVVSATHDRGEWMGLVPTGKQFKALLVLVHRIVEGKIAEEWSQGSGLAELTQQRLEQEMRERIEQELRVARSIQQASLPEEVPTLEGWRITPYYYGVLRLEAELLRTPFNELQSISVLLSGRAQA
jgi:predicted ester cyclase